MSEETTRKAWVREFEVAAAAIRDEWIWTEESDGWQGINPAYAEHPLVKHYLSVQQIGYARGWL